MRALTVFTVMMHSNKGRLTMLTETFHFVNLALAELFANQLVRFGRHTPVSAEACKVNLALYRKAGTGSFPYTVEVDEFGDVSLEFSEVEMRWRMIDHCKKFNLPLTPALQALYIRGMSCNS